VTAYDTLLKAVQALHIFRRNKRPLETKVLACLLYMSGLSYRSMTYQTGIIGSSHVAVFYWVRALGSMVSKVPKRERRIVAMDETVVKLQGREVYVWGAIDVDTEELLAVYASRQRAFVNTIEFSRRVLRTCTNRPVILVDGGPWYPWALERMGLKWLHVTFGLRNSIERLFRTLKERTRRFYNNVPSKRDDLKNVSLFMELFMLWYNHLRRHQTLGRVPVEVSLS
jgi:transposase-like protein